MFLLGLLLGPSFAHATYLETGISGGVYDHQDGTRDLSFNVLLSNSVKVSETIGLSALVSGSSDLSRPGEENSSDFGAAQMTASYKPWTTPSGLIITPRTTLALPASRYARENQTLLFSLKPAISVSLKSPTWKTSVDFSIARNVHTYDISLSGNSNAEYGSAQVLSVENSITEKLLVSLSLSHYNSWTYSNVAQEYFSHSQDLSYLVNKQLKVQLGHTYGNPFVSVYSADGESLNLGLISEQYSTFYSQIGYIF